MVLKRILFALVIIFWAFQAQSQISTTNFEVIVSWDQANGIISVSETLQFAEGMNEKFLMLQSLDFKDATIQNLNVSLNGETIPVSLNKNEHGLLEKEMSVKQLEILVINYQIKSQPQQIVAPLIFTPIIAQSSNENLFSAKIKIPVHNKLVESFPTISKDAVVVGNQKIYEVALPVIPSLIKMKVANESDFKMGITEILDALVLVTLGLLAVIGWKKRKTLA